MLLRLRFRRFQSPLNARSGQSKALVEIAATAMQVNLAKCASQVAPAMEREFRSLVA